MEKPTLAALAPYRVLDLTGAIGGLCGRVLAGLGADVIKVERPGGEPARLRAPFLGGVRDPQRSLPWLFANAGKRGITLDIEQPDGREKLLRLVAQSDVLIESFPPGQMEKLGLGWRELCAANPRLIFTRISPFGQNGPYSDYQGSDIVAWALGGQMFLDGDAERRPVRVSAPQAEGLAGAHAAAGTMTALYHRRRSGRGQQVDVAMQECVTWTLMIAAQFWDILHINPQRGGAIRRTQRPDGSTLESRAIWPCKDGYVLWALGGGTQAGSLASARALTAWLTDEGLAGPLAEVNWSELSAATMDQSTYDALSAPFLAFFAQHTKQELFEGAIARSIQLAPVNEIPDVAASPQLAARDYWRDVPQPQLATTLRFPGAPVRLAATPWRDPTAAPRPGEHNAEVFAELLALAPRSATS
jgi:crotonobetainyl-CoA:carnitine CoA-transferase CaiB-like acyl-CoA transferase